MLAQLKLITGITVAALFIVFSFLPHGWAEDSASNSLARSVIDSQIKSFQTGDHQAAFEHASPNLKKLFKNTDNFIRMVKSGYGAIYGAQSWTFGRSQTVSGTYYQEVQLIGPNGNNWVAVYSMQQQTDGSWKITAVQIKRGDGRTT